MATANEVEYAWKHFKFDVFACGLIADGRIAIPVQKTHNDLKPGTNIGQHACGQGFFYTTDIEIYNDPSKAKKVKFYKKNGFPTTFITDGTKNPLIITPKVGYTFDDLRKGLRYDFTANLHGIDLTTFNPVDVSGSFKTSDLIFDDLRDNTYEYYQQTTGIYVPNGFRNTGDTNAGSGNFSKKTIIGGDKMKEAWSIGAKASVKIPVPKKPGTSVVPELGFKYGESKVENSSESDVFITNSERKIAYNLELVDITEVVLAKKIKRAVEGIRSLRDARRVVETYGTHYTDNVWYGGHVHTLIRINENTFYKAHEKNLDINAAVQVNEASSQTHELKDNTITTQGTPGSSSLGRGELSLSWQKNQSHGEIYGDIKSEYWYNGGKGNIKSWDADRDEISSYGLFA